MVSVQELCHYYYIYLTYAASVQELGHYCYVFVLGQGIID